MFFAMFVLFIVFAVFAFLALLLMIGDRHTDDTIAFVTSLCLILFATVSWLSYEVNHKIKEQDILIKNILQLESYKYSNNYHLNIDDEGMSILDVADSTVYYIKK